jgi:hypothetical protein
MSSEVEMQRQEGRIQIPLHWPNATGTLMPALCERLLDVVAAAMTVLGQFAGVGRNFMQGAASSRPSCVSNAL